jgi:hypothetical protein
VLVQPAVAFVKVMVPEDPTGRPPTDMYVVLGANESIDTPLIATVAPTELEGLLKLK